MTLSYNSVYLDMDRGAYAFENINSYVQDGASYCLRDAGLQVLSLRLQRSVVWSGAFVAGSTTVCLRGRSSDRNLCDNMVAYI